MTQVAMRATIGRLLDDWAERTPHAEALVVGERRLTYTQLREATNAIARGLLHYGVRRGEHVAVLMTNTADWIAIYYAVAKIGAVLVPINTRYAPAEVEFALRQSNSRALILMDRFRNHDYAHMIAELAPELATSRVGELRVERLPRLRLVVSTGDWHARGVVGWDDFSRDGAEASGAATLEAAQAQVQPEDAAMIMYTSGSTSFPKGCLLTQAGIIRNALLHTERLHIGPSDRWFTAMPFFHSGGAIWSSVSCLVRGACLVSTEYFEPTLTLETIARERCTYIHGMDTMYVMWLNHPELDRFDLSSVRSTTTTGAVELRWQIYHRMHIAGVCGKYGITEAYGNLSLCDAQTDPLAKRIESCGRIFDGVEYRVCDPTTNAPLAAGEVGEIQVRGMVMRGYYEMPDETARAIEPDGWLHTGDLCSIDAEGYVYFEGRLKDMLKVGGENVASAEIEACLYTFAKVKQVHVIGVPDTRLTEVPMACIDLKEGEVATAEEIIAFCKSRLAAFKVPRYVEFRSEFPQTGSGKVQKFALRQEVLEHLQVG